LKIFKSLLLFILSSWSLLFSQLNLPINHYILRNGLKVVLLEDRKLPVITLAVVYHTGSRDDPVGKTGRAQLMQNIMFSGTETVPPMGHFAMIRRYGGVVNAFVTEDYIIFYQTLPSSQMKLALWLESERMRNLKIENSFFMRQKELMIAEIRRKIEDEPFAEGFLKLNEISFLNFSYAHPVMGYIEDIENIELEDIKSYYLNYFQPANAWLIMVGDIDIDSSISIIKEFFEQIPSKEVKLSKPPLEGYRRGELRMRTFKKGIYQNMIYAGYPIPPRSSPEFYVLKVIEYILVHDKNSILTRELITKRNIVQEITGEVEEREGSSLFTFFILGRPGISSEMLFAHFSYQMEKFSNNVVGAWEVERAKNALETDYLDNLRDTEGKALALARLCIYNESPHMLNTELKRFLKVNQFDVYRVAKKYFDKDNGVFLYVIPQR